MVDFHSHILPGLDDGSKDISMSLKMLNMSYNQGVKKIIATPHFFADDSKIEQAIDDRNKSYQEVMDEANRQKINIPEIMLGFEVFISKALLKNDNIKSLCIEGTKTMLIELPFDEWGESTFGIVKYLIEECGIVPLIAHIERYLDRISSGKFNRLLGLGYFAQVNANSFINRQYVNKIEEMILNKQIHVVGSDAHNLLRCSLMDVAYNNVRNKIGESYIDFFEENANILMST